jgi:hypothetical protein
MQAHIRAGRRAAQSAVAAGRGDFGRKPPADVFDPRGADVDLLVGFAE